MSRYTLRGVDGKRWGFDPAGGDPLRLKYVRGITGAPFKHDTSHGVDQAGVTVHGRDQDANIIELGVFIEPGVKGDDAVRVGRAWQASLGNGMGLGRFIVSATRRFQETRYVSDTGIDFDKLYNTGFAYHEVKIASDESWWRTKPRAYEFAPADFATATVRNDGDAPSWWWARLHGPINTPTLGVAGEAIPLPYNIATGWYLDIQTDPDWYEAVDSDGVDRAWFGQRWRKQAPARTREIPVTITGSGTTSATKLEMIIPQLYERAL